MSEQRGYYINGEYYPYKSMAGQIKDIVDANEREAEDLKKMGKRGEGLLAINRKTQERLLVRLGHSPVQH